MREPHIMPFMGWSCADLSYMRMSSMTGMVRSVPAWYVAKLFMAAACLA